MAAILTKKFAPFATPRVNKNVITFSEKNCDTAVPDAT
jgi:hypothetical protein